LAGVAIPEEGLQLRRVGITKPIIALGGTYHEDLRLYAEYDIAAVVFQAERIRQLECPAR